MGVHAAVPLALGIAAMLVVASGARADSVLRPSLTAGDYWTYATNSTVAGLLDLVGRLTSRVAGRESIDVGGRPTDVYRVILNGSGTAHATLPPSMGSFEVTANWLLTGEDFLDSEQLKTVRSLFELDVTQSGTNTLLFQAQNVTTYEILDDGWRYPLAPGATGTVTMGYTFSQTTYSVLSNATSVAGNGTWTLGFSMGAAESASVAAGVFQAYPIVETWPDGTSSRFLFSATVGNDVRTEAFDAAQVRVSVSDLVAYRYQAAEPPTFLGLTLVGWALVASVAAAAVVILVYLRRRNRLRPSPPLNGPGPSP